MQVYLLEVPTLDLQNHCAFPEYLQIQYRIKKSVLRSFYSKVLQKFLKYEDELLAQASFSRGEMYFFEDILVNDHKERLSLFDRAS